MEDFTPPWCIEHGIAYQGEACGRHEGKSQKAATSFPDGADFLREDPK